VRLLCVVAYGEAEPVMYVLESENRQCAYQQPSPKVFVMSGYSETEEAQAFSNDCWHSGDCSWCCFLNCSLSSPRLRFWLDCPALVFLSSHEA
jgi:hypothetical protein